MNVFYEYEGTNIFVHTSCYTYLQILFSFPGCIGNTRKNCAEPANMHTMDATLYDYMRPI